MKSLSYNLKSLIRPLYFNYEKFLYERNVNTVVNFKNNYQKKSCLIVGNGPSINNTPLDKIKIPSFGLNKINLLFDKTTWRPNFIVCSNKHVVKQNINFYENTSIPTFIAFQSRYYLKKNKHIHFYLNSYKNSFSNDASKIMFAGGTVTYSALQLAFFMGFEQIFLVGVDHNFVDKGPAHKLVKSSADDLNHFDKSYFGKGVSWQLPDLDMSEKSFKLADQFFRNHGRKVYDATINGKLDIFEKISINQLIKMIE